MMNCWEINRCGREPGGSNSKTLGSCIAATETRVNGFNQGKNGGRVCWAVAGSFSGEKPQCVFLEKIRHCFFCPFFLQVQKEEGTRTRKVVEVLKTLN